MEKEEFTILSHTKTKIIIIIFWLTDLNILMDGLEAQLFGSNKGIQICWQPIMSVSH